MTFIKPYQEYLIRLFLKNLIIVTFIFASLSFILNILEEVKFFKEFELGFYYPIIFTGLNLPSILFEIFPFIILISTQMFFMHLYNRDEINIFKNYGIKNTDIIKIVSIITLFFGFFLVFGFHIFSSNLKYNYLSFKNNFTDDNKYLAVINENGLWIKDEIDGSIIITNAKKMESNYLVNVSISKLNEDFQLIETIIAENANIKDNIWIINKPKIYGIEGSKDEIDLLRLNSNFNLEKINNLFSNLTSLNLFQLKSQYDDYKRLGYSTLELESQMHKLIALPIYLIIMILIGSMIMFNARYNKSKIFNVVSGILLSVMIYYINYFFNVMGLNERIPVILSIWFPLFILILISTMGLLKVNDK